MGVGMGKEERKESYSVTEIGQKAKSPGLFGRLDEPLPPVEGLLEWTTGQLNKLSLAEQHNSVFLQLFPTTPR